jgi:Xaa-Pro dipeptidase
MDAWYQGNNRRERVQDAIGRNGFDLLLALTPEHASYLAGQTDFMATHWRLPGIHAVVVSPDGQRAIVSGEFGTDPAVTTSDRRFPYIGWTESVDVRNSRSGPLPERITCARPFRVSRPVQFDRAAIFDQVAEAIRSLEPRASRVGVDLEETDMRSFAALQDRLPGVVLEDATGILDDLRALKDPDEIAHLRLAAELTEIGIAGAIRRIEPGWSAVAINAAYQSAIQEAVIADTRFRAFRQAEGAVQIGIGHDAPAVIEPGQTIKFDMQVDVGGYHSDIGRTYAIAPTPDQERLFQDLRVALDALIATVLPGTTFGEVYEAGTKSMHDVGYTAYSRGHLGHSVGLTQHFEEPPFIAPGEQRTIQPGMVLSVEMPYYVYGIGAFQMERMGVVHPSGFELLDQLPFNLALDS